METKKIEVGATINSTPQKVWEYWTTPKHITKWNFANDDWHCPKATNDLRVGGKMSYRMEAKDGSAGFDFKAINNEVKAPEKIVYTMEDGRVATITFEPHNMKTKLTIIFDAEQQNSIEMQKSGWQAIVNNFKDYIEAN